MAVENGYPRVLIRFVEQVPHKRRCVLGGDEER